MILEGHGDGTVEDPATVRHALTRLRQILQGVKEWKRRWATPDRALGYVDHFEQEWDRGQIDTDDLSSLIGVLVAIRLGLRREPPMDVDPENVASLRAKAKELTQLLRSWQE